MTRATLLSRRIVLAGLALTIVATRHAHGQSPLDASSLGVQADTGQDQSQALQAAMDQAASTGQLLRLPPGVIEITELRIPGNLAVEGVPGRTELFVIAGGAGISIGASAVTLREIGFSGGEVALTVFASDAITLERCRFRAASVGLGIDDAAVAVRDCAFTDIGDAAIHAINSRGVMASGNRIERCGNAGIRIWRDEGGPDGSIISGNRIGTIGWVGGGNGQNGNGVNVFNADNVIVADNHIADCAFTAVRLNATRDNQVSGNVCLHSGEVAIFSEFGFSGSVIANNIIDDAATGISITNLDTGGQLAVCTGNLVRNISPASAVNPDTIPIGIFAEADTAITGNSVQNVPGVAIGAGFGEFLRNVVIDGNMVSDSTIGIGVSVVEGAGSVIIGDNLVDASQHAVVGLAWTEVVETDLLGNAERYSNVTLS